MRAVLERWIKSSGDLGGIPEDELIERIWPGRKQPVTATPAVQISSVRNSKATVKITCATKGVSIGYRLGKKQRWLIYTKPIRLDVGTELHTRAIRIGYKPSEEVHKLVGN